VPSPTTDGPVPEPVRVAAVPAAHPYVTGLGLPPAAVRLLADPPVPGAPPGRWWPPVMLGPAWIAGHRDRFDVMHVHFGMESFSVAALAGAVSALRAAGRPLVHTVHDLSNPQLDEQSHHRAQLDVIIPAADALITLTSGAAAEIERRWGRAATVIPHPAMLTGPVPVTALRAGPPLIGVHLRDLRPSIDGPGTVRTLAAALGRLAARGIPAAGRVWMHARVRDPAGAAEVRATCAQADGIELIVAPRSGDAALIAELDALSVSLLPYRHGTHSGWLELCVDLGVPVAVPEVGHIGDQHPDPEVCRTFASGDADGLADALAGLLALAHARPGSRARARERARRAAARAAQRAVAVSAHLAIYRELAMRDRL
jgi:hypothetical protein